MKSLKNDDIENEIYAKQLAELYPNVFSGKLGKLKGVKVKIDVNKSIAPTQEKHRHLPFHLRDKVEKELNNMLQQDIIERVKSSDKVTWLSPIVPVTKSNWQK